MKCCYNCGKYVSDDSYFCDRCRCTWFVKNELCKEKTNQAVAVKDSGRGVIITILIVVSYILLRYVPLFLAVLKTYISI